MVRVWNGWSAAAAHGWLAAAMDCESMPSGARCAVNRMLEQRRVGETDVGLEWTSGAIRWCRQAVLMVLVVLASCSGAGSSAGTGSVVV